MAQRIVASVTTDNPGVVHIRSEEIWSGERLIVGCSDTPISGIRDYARKMVSAGKAGTIKTLVNLPSEGLSAGTYDLAEL